MKRRFISFLIVLSIITSLVLFNNINAYADPFTASQIASASYALMNSWGISFSAGNATASGMNDFLTQNVESYVNSHGGSIADVFVGNMAVDAAGKLVVAHDLYNSIKSFTGWLASKYDLSDVDFTLTNGRYDDYFLPYTGEGETSITGVGIEAMFSDVRTASYFTDYGTYYGFVQIYNGGAFLGSINATGGGYGFLPSWELRKNQSLVTLYVEEFRSVSSSMPPVHYGWRSYNVATTSGDLPNSLVWNGADYVEPTVLNPDKEWTGTIGGYSVPDTNLDQLLGDIDQAVADNNLVVDGEVIDIPIPPPTPGPIDPDTPLSDVPWEGLDTNLTDLYNQGLEEIGAIGDAKDAITDALAEQTGTLEDAIADNAGVVSGAIDQAVSDIQDAISEQTQTLSDSASATAEATESIAEALEDETINWQKFDLRGLFPFCIPFDIYNMLEALDASPSAPHVQLPFVIESIGFSYTIDLDFSDFDSVAAVMRQMELIVYGIALAWATSKVIKW